jgi:hypothetical protein
VVKGENDGFELVRRKPTLVNKQIRRSETKRLSILGTKDASTNGGIKSGVKITRKSVLHIDNLDKDCSVESLTKFVEDLGVHVISCFPSKSWMKGDARDFVCAFRLCIDAKDKDTICLPTYWPSGVMIREWVFKPKNQNGSTN